MAAPHFVQRLQINKKKTLASPACVKKPDDRQLRFSSVCLKHILSENRFTLFEMYA